MAQRKWTKEEITEWRKQNRQMAYFNKDDSNILVPKGYGPGFTMNWGNPLSWVAIVAVFAIAFAIKFLLVKHI